MNEQTNESMATMTIRVPKRLRQALIRAGERLEAYYTTLARRCLIAIVEPSEFGDMVLSSVRAASVLSETGMDVAQEMHEMDRTRE